MTDNIQLGSYFQLCNSAQLYNQSQMYKIAQLYEENLLCGDWFSFADTSELCDLQPLSQYGGLEWRSALSSPASLVSTDSFFTHQTSPTPSIFYLPLYISTSTSTPTASAYSSPDATASQEVTSLITESLTFISSSCDYPVCCLHPGCNAKPFKRCADLDRHYKHIHTPSSQKDSYYCDYTRCGRRQDPFHRRDHFRDHLRDFHKEDIEKRGVITEGDWFERRNASHTWWRCTKCLERIYISRHGYECPTCKTFLQAKRKDIRRRET